MIGLFVKQTPKRAFRRDQVADMNTSMAKNAATQLYARDGEFELHTRMEPYTRGKDLAAALGRQAKAKGQSDGKEARAEIWRRYSWSPR